MRALLTVQPSVGHLHPLVPVARALSDAGHEVAVCTAASFRPDVEAFGLTHVAAGLDWSMSDRSTWGAFPPMPPPGPEFPGWVVTTLADIAAGRMVPDLLAIAREWEPDLIVREGMELGGCIAAERLGIPHASVAGNAYAAVDSPDIDYFTGNRRMLAEPLTRQRERVGLPPGPDVRMPFRHLHMCFTPPAWDGASAPRPPNARFLRQTDTLSPGAELPGWVSSGSRTAPRCSPASERSSTRPPACSRRSWGPWPRSRSTSSPRSAATRAPAASGPNRPT